MKKGPFKMKGFSGFGNSLAKFDLKRLKDMDLKYFFAGPKGRKRQDAEFENKIRMENDAPRKLPEVTVVGKRNTRDKGPKVGN